MVCIFLPLKNKKDNIEVDAAVWHHLQRHAEPFVDTPNSVLKRLLFGETGPKIETPAVLSIPSVSIQGLPKSLAQILEVVYEMKVNGYSRTQATNRVAKKKRDGPSRPLRINTAASWAREPTRSMYY